MLFKQFIIINFAEAYHLGLNLKRDDALDELEAHLLLECIAKKVWT